MSKGFNYIIFTILIAVLVISFAVTYNGGDDFVITESVYKDDNIIINVFKNDDKINLQMASISPEIKLELAYDSNKSSTFAPGYSTFNLDDLDVQLKTYRKWLQIVWLPYQSIEIDLNEENLEELPEEGLMKFKAQFAEKLMQYYVENE